MLKFDQTATADEPAYSTVTLTFEARTRARQKVALDNGETASLFQARGKILSHGQKLMAESGEIVEIVAADEAVSTVFVADALLLARACYHLGNRHVALQIGAGFLRYQHDHVLDDMLIGLGLEPVFEQAPFEPESGAYGAGHHSHGHHEH